LHRRMTCRTSEFRRCNSKDFEISEKADVLIHEQIGSAIFNENMIENVTDLRDRVLKAGGRILPNRFEVFLEPVQIKEEYRVPFIWEFKIHGISFEALKGRAAKSSENGQSLKSEEWIFIRTFEIERLLCNPKSIMQFDLETMTNDYKPGRIVYRNRVLEDSRVDGLLLYFNAIFDDEFAIETSPMNSETSWLPALLRIEHQHLPQGTLVEYELDVDDVRDYRSWRLNLRTVSEVKPLPQAVRVC
jgi:protein arginine N-methyltransferase 1